MGARAVQIHKRGNKKNKREEYEYPACCFRQRNLATKLAQLNVGGIEMSLLRVEYFAGREVSRGFEMSSVKYLEETL